MTSTPVKDMGSVLNGFTPSGGNIKTAANREFQAVLDGQTGRNQGESRKADSQPDPARQTVKKTPGDSLRAKDAHQARVADKKAQDGEAAQETGEISEEAAMLAAEALGTAAADMMQKIADAFGIDIPELENAMQELGMERMDVLDRGKLGELLLTLGGAQDACELVTDGELYDSYRELMADLDTLLQEAGQQTGLDPEQLQTLMQNRAEMSPAETAPFGDVAVEDPEQLQTTRPQEDGEDVREPQEEQETGKPDRLFGEEISQKRQTDADEAQTGPETDKRGEEPDRGGQRPVFAHSFREQFQPQTGLQTEAPEAASQTWRADTQDIMRQIMDYMRVQVKPDTSSLEMQLHPESLGSLHVQVASRGGVVTASFIAQNETVKAALESQIVQLRENFEQQGVRVEAIEVTVEAHAFERNLDQGRGQGSAQEQDRTARRIRTRRINLNEPADMEDLEEEDALAAEMLAASGSQVDYTA